MSLGSINEELEGLEVLGVSNGVDLGVGLDELVEMDEGSEDEIEYMPPPVPGG